MKMHKLDVKERELSCLPAKGQNYNFGTRFLHVFIFCLPELSDIWTSKNWC